MHFKTKLILMIAALLTFILSSVLKHYPYFVDKYYSISINSWTRQIQNFIAGLFPFSIAEILFLSLVIALIILIVLFIVKIITGGALRQLINILAYFSVLYILFMFLWGFNYDRLPFDKIAGLKIEASTEEQLKGLCQKLIYKADDLRKRVKVSSDGIMVESGGYKDVFSRAEKGYEKAALIFPELSGRYSLPKPIFLSEALCYTGIEGIYMPYTGEANVNVKIPDFMLPCTADHEMAHQRGFAREDEANYISYITCSLNPDTDFQYSGVMLALIYSMNALADTDIKAYKNLTTLYSPGVKDDLIANDKFWAKYSGKIETTSNRINDSYLKSNGQADGTKSYGRMVDLLLAQYKKGTL